MKGFFLLSLYSIAKNFRGRKLSQFGGKKILVEKTFAGVTAKRCHAPNFTKKTFANSCKTSKFKKAFSLESFPLYGTSFQNVFSQICESSLH